MTKKLYNISIPSKQSSYFLCNFANNEIAIYGYQYYMWLNLNISEKSELVFVLKSKLVM